VWSVYNFIERECFIRQRVVAYRTWCGLPSTFSNSSSSTRSTIIREQDYCKSYRPISLKLAVMIGPWLPIGRTDWLLMMVRSQILRITFPLPQHSRMGYCRRFISTSHTVTGRYSQLTGDDKISGAIRQTSRSKSGLIRESWFESRITYG